MIPADDIVLMRQFFERLPSTLPEPPRALLVISAHWEAQVPTVMAASHPPLLYDYSGFPPESYKLSWPAPGSPELARKVIGLLTQAGIDSAADTARGFDHGTFIPLKLSWPQAEVPTIQLSLQKGLDPATHLALGRALAPLRDEGVLIIGSGMSYHNLRSLFARRAGPASLAFDEWLKKAACAAPPERDRFLLEWQNAPGAREAHPREEHLLPLMVTAGAAGTELGGISFNEDWMGARISAVRFG